MPEETYKFTRRQLNDLLLSTIDMFIEYKRVHGKTEQIARYAAVREMFEGLDADKELVQAGEVKPILQIVEVEN